MGTGLLQQLSFSYRSLVSLNTAPWYTDSIVTLSTPATTQDAVTQNLVLLVSFLHNKLLTRLIGSKIVYFKKALHFSQKIIAFHLSFVHYLTRICIKLKLKPVHSKYIRHPLSIYQFSMVLLVSLSRFIFFGRSAILF